jgi:O-methyltransferase involved in polyketide biosynthesis
MTLVGEDWPALAAMLTAVFSDTVVAEATAGHAVRCRYAEDQLDLSVHRQYVLLGAGLDSFAWRRPDLLGEPVTDKVDDDILFRWRNARRGEWFRHLRVFEVDHPATQAWKRSRAAALSLPSYEGQVFASVDFESETLRDGLSAAGFDWTAPTLFSWLGVTMYLTREAIAQTLEVVATCAPKSRIAFTYVPVAQAHDTAGREYLDKMAALASSNNEPFLTLMTEAQAEELVVASGLQVLDHPTRDDLVTRYFAGRPDGLRPSTFERLMVAGVVGGAHL